MAPTRSKKQNSSESLLHEANSENAPSQVTIIPQHQNRVTTPDKSPKKQAVAITQAQKQAIIDNLQLEITERARKLRAQYALQAHGLRSRLEMRINRIPQALRKAKLGDLLAKHTEQENAPKPDPPQASTTIALPAAKQLSPPKPKIEISKDATRTRGTKRTRLATSTLSTLSFADTIFSNQMTSDDKENEMTNLAMPKKRAKNSGPSAPPARATRTASRKVNPSQVLSPKSNNSRTFPQSPMRPPPPPLAKSHLAKPVSPYKPASTVEAATASLAGLVNDKPKAPRAPSRQAKTGAATTTGATASGAGRGRKAASKVPQAGAGHEHIRSSDGSNTSDVSAGTTIVTKPKVERKAPLRKGLGAQIGVPTATTKRGGTVQGKKETNITAPAEGRRVLRKR
ncbi:MAG: hypothetical protein Q9165_006133 [Trypethelium subeluteriae]